MVVVLFSPLFLPGPVWQLGVGWEAALEEGMAAVCCLFIISLHSKGETLQLCLFVIADSRTQALGWELLIRTETKGGRHRTIIPTSLPRLFPSATSRSDSPGSRDSEAQ